MRSSFYILFSGLLLWGCTVKKEPQKEYTLVWSDEFNEASIDTTKWDYQTGTGAQFGLNGWGNNELQYYTDSGHNTEVSDGNLIIEARRESYEGMEFTSAKLVTQNKADWLYGRFEIRAKLPQTQGIWPAIWMMPTNSEYGGWPRSGEIDIMEMLGHQPDTVYANVHFGNSFEDRGSALRAVTLEDGSSFSDDFHTYSIEWEPNTIKWFLDGRHYHTVTPEDVTPYRWPFDQPYYLILNIAVGGNWPGNPDETTVLPQEMLVDFVKIYQKDNK